MNDLPRRRLLDRMAATPTMVAAHTVVRGDFEADGPLLVNGTVHGNARVGGEVALTTGARWHGNIEAHSVVIAGEIDGEVLATDKLEVHASAVVRGTLRARRVAIARGARIEGDIACTGDEPVVQFEERRHRDAPP